MWNFFTTLLNYLNPLSEDFILLQLWNFLTNIFTSIGTILSYINPFSQNFFGYKLIDLFSDLLNFLFVPSQERLTAITNSVSSKFDFIDSIKYSIQYMENMLNNLGNAPKLELTLGATNYTPEQKYIIIDFSFYAPYKTYGDLILTGFIYLFFIWRLFISIPDIIHGSGGSIGSLTGYISAMEDFHNLRD